MKKMFQIFDMNKPGKGVGKSEKVTYTFLNFFKLAGRKMTKLVYVNLLFVFANFPVFFYFLALSGNFSISFRTPADPLYAVLHGLELHGGNPGLSALLGVSGINVVSRADSPVTRTLYWLTLLLLITYGLANVGMTYLLRNYARQEHVYLVYDFFRAIKKNFFQGIGLGVIDLLASFLLIYDVYFFYVNTSSPIFTVFFFVSLFLGLIYLFMRFYMYIILVTFRLSLWKIIKNSFIFAIVGIKRNIVALFGILLFCLLNYFLYLMFLPLGAILPFFISFSLCAFMAAYAAYPNIKRLMIDPYYPEETEEEGEAETIFTDRES